MTQEELNELASDCRLAFGHQAGAYNDGVDAMLRAVSIAQAQAAAQCIGKDPLCPCQDGDTCHYEGKDAWPVPQHFPFMPWSKETEMMESWAKHGAVEPVAWMHDETGLIVRVSDIAKTSYNEPRIKSGEFSPLYASQPDHTKAMRLALEIIRLQREWIMAVPQDTVLPVMPGFDREWVAGFDREWVDRQIAALEKEVKHD